MTNVRTSKIFQNSMQDSTFLGGRIEIGTNYEFQYNKVDFKSLPDYKRSFSSSWDTEKADYCLQNPNFMNCEYYCQDFNIAKATDLFDGDMSGVKRTFDILRNYHADLTFFHENELSVDFIKIERYVDEHYYHQIFKERFIIASDPSSLDVGELSSDFTVFGAGVNPFKLGEGNTLRFYFKKINIWVMRGVVIWWVMLLSEGV